MAIIDGMGSCEAALSPLLTGHLVTRRGGFDNVFLMLYMAAAAASLLLSKLTYKEASVDIVHHCKPCTCSLGDTMYKHVQQRMVMAVSRTRLL